MIADQRQQQPEPAQPAATVQPAARTVRRFGVTLMVVACAVAVLALAAFLTGRLDFFPAIFFTQVFLGAVGIALSVVAALTQARQWPMLITGVITVIFNPLSLFLAFYLTIAVLSGIYGLLQ